MNENSINVLIWNGLQDVLVSEGSECRALPRVCYFECNEGELARAELVSKFMDQARNVGTWSGS